MSDLARGPSWPAVLFSLAALAIVAGLLFPWAASAYYAGRGGRHLDAARLARAEVDLRQALAWDSGNAQAARLLAQLYRAREDWPAVVRAWADYVALAPKNPLGYWELAAACESLDEPDLARVPGAPCGRDEASRQEALSRLWRAAGQSADSFIRAGDQMRWAERWDQAEAHYRRALILDPEAAGAWLGLGLVFQARGDGLAAMEAYARATAPGADPAVAAQAHRRRG
ncbi:MAG: hypothetical protein PVF47_18110, partial [Anaerolineae bacterium]